MSYLPTNGYHQPLGASWLDRVGTGIKDAGSWAIKTYAEGQRSAGAARAAQEIAKAQATYNQQQPRSAGFQQYLPHIAVGGAGLIAVLLLTRRQGK